MEEHEVDPGRENRQSLHSVNSAVEAMQRAADRLIATTESFRVQFRERQDARESQREGETATPFEDALETRPSSRPATATNDVTKGAAGQDHTLPFTSNDANGTASTGSNPSASLHSTSPGTYPAQIPDDLPSATSPATPQPSPTPGKDGDEQLAFERPPFSLLREAFIVFVICFAQLLAYAAFAQALAPAQKIAESFPNSAPAHLSWYTAAYAMGVFIAGFAWFSLWSTLAGLSVYVERSIANGTIYFCVCRGLQGLGAAIIVPNAQAILDRVYVLGPRRNLVMCLLSASAPLGFVAGAVMASLFAELTSWEWAFFVLGAVCLTFACQGMIVLPADTGLTTGMRTVKF
ncbi:unnamed protein product [Parascedosporium putredinis]|uniref:Major facilitator superfamily (MFS) profile domain-containing protein n=1 Tax=Parascedosporium putredinis TaxID=1442378 RepID=A0A9P1MAR8_9PEZI|nr:unnamed protein product [Parascedosporium putredinis]CAI7994636.1 unnamed protein product [Parascedosporium putredinis]